jgi:hypothetical protein
MKIETRTGRGQGDPKMIAGLTGGEREGDEIRGAIR